MEAISTLGHQLIAAHDIHDSVGVLDRYAPDAAFFTEFERFDRHLSKLLLQGVGPDYLVVCTPNYLHDAHARFGLRLGVDVICEKPVALNLHNLQAVQELERACAHHVWCILQARLHPEVQRLQRHLAQSAIAVHEVEIDYVTPRGKWYDYSWKGDPARSGGVEANIGVHLFDLVTYLFGQMSSAQLTDAGPRHLAGTVSLADATVRFRVSVRKEDLPATVSTPIRKFLVDGEAFDLSTGFEDLHLESYRRILAGEGYRLADAAFGVTLTQQLRQLRTFEG